MKYKHRANPFKKKMLSYLLDSLSLPHCPPGHIKSVPSERSVGHRSLPDSGSSSAIYGSCWLDHHTQDVSFQGAMTTLSLA